MTTSSLTRNKLYQCVHATYASCYQHEGEALCAVVVPFKAPTTFERAGQHGNPYCCLLSPSTLRPSCAARFNGASASPPARALLRRLSMHLFPAVPSPPAAPPPPGRTSAILRASVPRRRPLHLLMRRRVASLTACKIHRTGRAACSQAATIPRGRRTPLAPPPPPETAPTSATRLPRLGTPGEAAAIQEAWCKRRTAEV